MFAIPNQRVYFIQNFGQGYAVTQILEGLNGNVKVCEGIDPSKDVFLQSSLIVHISKRLFNIYLSSALV